MRIANITAAIIGMLFSCLAFIQTLFFKQFKNVPVGPEFLPRYLAVGLFLCCFALLLQNILKKEAKGKEEECPTINPLNLDIQRVLVAIGIILLSCFLWQFLGFLLVTPFTLFFLMFILKKRNYLLMLILSVVITAVVFLAFRFLLGIAMPMGFFAK